ncbi:Myb-like DNA-binding domain containing protein [Trichomonas vaginalis G3]|uniref:Myb-like DNA-binding domain containing protein n=1 Tax=Trichomonas vaginalis (strain ATCC PRA-98 / G3) TaxID=412133 RepID=A2EYY7_TRIV3|nr:RNA polymerase II transcription regulator recruiting protein [Trichomonas vaginalis G3]EAY02149.1 Myb-like DNA-binding domain containing protein [Trichomonas vaginalis G3]KAI5513757.1 RNA polymerase II transcription regulator recruiting protein [Trichomonas vaginalis G3]|eukprot:XP_001330857.1 Myb-like DNA-binding domain containing protein [Trichomonas vaginalis G3]
MESVSNEQAICNTKSKRFTPEEDAIIKELVEVQKLSPWSQVAKHLPGRTGAQCRDRYNTYLYCEISSKNWTHEEDEIIIEKYREYGPRWVMIAQHLPGRNGKSVKNRWIKALKRYHGISHKDIKYERRFKKSKWERQEDDDKSLTSSEVDSKIQNNIDSILSMLNFEDRYDDIFDQFVEPIAFL